MSPLRRLTGGWEADPWWGSAYDWIVEHPVLGGTVWRLGTGSDLRLLHRAAEEIGRLPAGARVLDVPCGGGVALRGVRPGQDLAYVAADLSPRMLARTREAARARGVAERVTTLVCDVAALPLEDASVDLVVSLTGLHCFPDPRRAVHEMGRVLRPGGVLTGSAILDGTGLRHRPLRAAGRASNLIGPSGSASDVRRWLGEAGLRDVSVRVTGAIGWFRGVRAS